MLRVLNLGCSVQMIGEGFHHDSFVTLRMTATLNDGGSHDVGCLMNAEFDKDIIFILNVKHCRRAEMKETEVQN